ncbi:MAG: hypothetical protein AAF235_04530 [Planctomycetota bacterium]
MPKTRLVILIASAALAVFAGDRVFASPAAIPLGVASESQPLFETQTPAEEAPGLGIAQTVGSLGLVVALIVLAGAGAKWLAKRQGGLAAQLGAGGRAPSGVAEIVARYPIARGQTVVLMRIGARVLVTFHATGGKNGPTMTRLCEIDDPEEIADLLVKTREAEAEQAQARFSEAIAQAESRHDAVRTDRPRPSAFRTVHTSAEGDRLELTNMNPAAASSGTNSATNTAASAHQNTGIDAVARLRERLAGLGVGPTMNGASSARVTP